MKKTTNLNILFIMTLACIILTSDLSWSQTLWTENGAAISASNATSIQHNSCSDGQGGIFTAFVKGSDSDTDIYIQWIDGSGSARWGTGGIAVNTESANQKNPAVLSDGQGNAYIAWHDEGVTNVKIQKVDNTGTLLWGSTGKTVSSASNTQELIKIVSDNAGGAILLWRDNRNGNLDLYAQRVDASGNMLWTNNGLPVITQANNQSGHQIISDGQGGAYIAWTDERGGTGSEDIYAQYINSSGSLQWDATGIAICTATALQHKVDMALSSNGNLFITWEDYRNTNADIYAQLVQSDGTLTWTINGEPICSASNNQLIPQIASDENQGAIITWSDNRTGYDIYAQRMNASGVPQWTANGISVYTSSSIQTNPGIVSDGAGGAFIIWNDLRNGSDYDLYGQHIESDSTFLWDENGVALCASAGHQLSQIIISDSAGGAMISWEDARDGKVLYAQSLNDNLSITAPTSESNWDGNQSQNITWSFRTENVYYHDLTLKASIQSGDGYPVSIAENVDPFTKMQSWTPDTINSTETRVMIDIYNDQNLKVASYSSDPFTIISNEAPTISDIPNQTTDEDVDISVNFNISDEETSSENLSLSVSSDNETLIPESNLTFGGSGSNRNLLITPAENRSGSATLTVTVSDGEKTASDNFTVTVDPVNDAPTISDIANQETDESTATGTINFTIDDIDTDIGTLTVSASSSNTTLVPNNNITLGGSDENRTIVLTPAANQNGTSTITVTVNDGDKTNTDTFIFTVNAVNNAPVLSDISDQQTDEDISLTINVQVNDIDTDLANLTLSATSTNATLVPNSNLDFSGSGTTRSFTLTPADNLSGSTTITVTLDDGDKTDTDTFTLTVNPTNDAPELADIQDQSTDEDTPVDVNIQVNDIDTDLGGLSLSGTSSNTTLVPNNNITFSGSGQNRSVSILPAANQSGTTFITVTLSDGDLTDEKTFTLTVNNENDAPTIAAISNQVTDEDNPITIDLQISDIDSDVDNLTLTANSSNTALLTTGNIQFSGTGANRTVTLDPSDDQSGNSTVTITVSDGDKTDSESFTFTVNPVNDAPSISQITSQTFTEDNPSTPIPFSIMDSETAPDDLILSVGIENTTLIPLQNAVFSGSGQNRYLTLTPAENQFGSTTVTITVSDGELSYDKQFTVTVTAENDAPTISEIANQSIDEDSSLTNLAFVIGDDETDASGLSLFASSGNTNLIPENNITFGGSGANRTVSVSPVSDQSGVAILIITVSDGDKTATENFTVTVNSVNDAPMISNISNQTINEDVTDFAIPFTISDIESAEEDLTASAISSNIALIPNDNIVLTGSNGSRSMAVTPLADQNGTTTITLFVSDGTDTTEQQFVITVTEVNDKPSITSADSVTVFEDSTFIYTALGSDTENDDLFFSYRNYPDWMQVQNDSIVGTPTEGRLDTTFTVIVRDASASDTLTVFVNVIPVNDPPVITSADTIVAIEKERMMYRVSADDPDGPKLVYTFLGIPSWITQTGPILSGTPGNYTQDTCFTIIASDSLLTDTLKVFVDVESINDPPVFDHEFPEPVFTISDSIDWEICLDDYASDPDHADSLLIWSFTLLDTVDLDIEILEQCHKLSITGEALPQDVRVVITVSDPLNASATDTLTLKLSTVKVDDILTSVPKEFELDQNYPNPFNPETTIQFGLPKAEKVTLIVYNILGQQVEILLENEYKKAGYHQLIWQGHSHPSGIYFYQIRTQSWHSVKRMVLMK